MNHLIPALLLGFTFALGLYALSEIDPGYVRISIGHWLIETNVLVLGLTICMLLVAWHFLARLLRRFGATSSFFSDLVQNRRSRRMRSKSSQGMLAYLEGNWVVARRLLSQSAEYAESPLVNYLAAAHAANELGQAREAEQLLKNAYECSQASDFAIGIAQAQLQMEEQDLEKCLATLVRLRKQQPEHPFVLKLLRSVYLKLGDWQQLSVLIPHLRKLPKANKDALDALETRVWQHLFAARAEELRRRHSQGELTSDDALATLWRQVPEPLRFDPRLIGSYARELLQLGCSEQSEVLLRKALGREWDDTLIHLYGLIESRDPAEQLLVAEQWLKARPNNSALLLTLGRLALRNQLWGKALEYFETSNRIQPGMENYAELCRLSSRLHPDAKGLKKWNEGLIRTLKLPTLPLPEVDRT
jgi:HemY protein